MSFFNRSSAFRLTTLRCRFPILPKTWAAPSTAALTSNDVVGALLLSDKRAPITRRLAKENREIGLRRSRICLKKHLRYPAAVV
jgi:hypothetical protein